ncbi:imm11 family protein [Tabrizicola sp.]|uniref:imm11 family protein n=1 Tax=Tabrizicola sp. TaxID=2005166 RepID=UPI003F2EF255
MVWGLTIRSGSFGSHRPMSSSPGYKERLVAHFDQLPPEEKAKYGNRSALYTLFVSLKFHEEPGKRLLPDLPEIDLPADHEWPTAYQTERQYSALNSLFMNEGPYSVDQPMKDIIERLEPGVHHFRPLRITGPNDEPYSGTYYTFIPGQYIHSFCPEQSSEKSWERTSDGRFSSRCLADPKCFAGLAFSKAIFGKAHLWCETRKFHGIDMYFSDQLIGEIKRAGLKVRRLVRLKEV